MMAMHLPVPVVLGKAVQLRQLRRRVLHDRAILRGGRRGRPRRGGRGRREGRRAGERLRLRTRVQPEHGGDDAGQWLRNRHRAGAAAIAQRAMDVFAQADLKCGLALLHRAFQNHVAAVRVRALDRQAIAVGKVGDSLQI